MLCPHRICHSQYLDCFSQIRSSSSSFGNSAMTLVLQTLSSCSFVSEPMELQKYQANKIHFPRRQLLLIFGVIT